MYIWFVFIESVHFVYICKYVLLYIPLYYLWKYTFCQSLNVYNGLHLILCQKSFRVFSSFFFSLRYCQKNCCLSSFEFRFSFFFCKRAIQICIYLYFYAYVYFCFFLINSPFCRIFSFLWLYVVFNQAAYLERIFRWYI